MFKMGCATVDVTPDFPVFLRGYGARNELSSGVADPIAAGVIALEQSGRKVLLITTDNDGVHAEICRLIAEKIESEFGIPADHVFISASHTHFAPGFSRYAVTQAGGSLELGIYPADTAFFEFWLGKVRTAVREALADLEEVTLDSAEIPVPGIAFNRRTVRKSDGLVTTNYVIPEDPENYTFSPIDDDFHVWRVMKGGRPKALLGRFGCHPVTDGGLSYEISADFPGAFRRAVERDCGGPAVFVQGTAGDVVPMRRTPRSREDIGEILSRLILLNELNFRPTGEFSLVPEHFTVPTRLTRFPETDDLEGFWKNALEEARRLPPEEAYLSLYEGASRYLLAKRFGKKEFDFPVSLLRLGNETLVFLPCEVLTDMGLVLRQACPEALVVSLTGGYEDYLPLSADFAKGGYETDSEADFTPDTGDRVLAACIDAVTKYRLTQPKGACIQAGTVLY